MYFRNMIIDGKSISKKIMDEIRERMKGNIHVKIAAIISKGDQESSVYFNSIKRNAEKVGINFDIIESDGNNFLDKIDEINENDDVTGIIVGRPFPVGITDEIVGLQLNPEKDIDCVTPHNLGLLNYKISSIAPATPKAAIDILELNGIPLKGKNVLIINRSITVGRPLANLLLNRDATVTVAHSKTSNIKELIDQNDIIVLGVGKPSFLKSSEIKGKKVIVDIGINVVDNKVVGDFLNDGGNDEIDYTPVPGGVGTVTSTEILKNAIDIIDFNKVY